MFVGVFLFLTQTNYKNKDRSWLSLARISTCLTEPSGTRWLSSQSPSPDRRTSAALQPCRRCRSRTFVSNEAVAAVGTNVPIVGLIVAFCIGLSIGANVVVARYLGMRKYDDASKAVHTAFATAVIFGVIAMVIGELCSSILMVWMQVPPNVVRHSEIYLQMYLLGMPFISIYNFLSAVMRSQGDTQTPLWALCIASVFNALGDLFVVTVVDWGIGGVALMTALANLLASGILVYRLMRTDGPLCLYPKRLFKMDKKALRSMIKIGWPAGLQSSVFSF